MPWKLRNGGLILATLAGVRRGGACMGGLHQQEILIGVPHSEHRENRLSGPLPGLFCFANPRPILRNPVLAERAERLQLLKIPHLTQQASSWCWIRSWWKTLKEVTSSYIVQQTLFQCISNFVCEHVAHDTWTRRFGRLCSDPHLPLKDTGWSCKRSWEQVQSKVTACSWDVNLHEYAA